MAKKDEVRQVKIPARYSIRVGGDGSKDVIINIDADSKFMATRKLVGYGIPYAVANYFEYETLGANDARLSKGTSLTTVDERDALAKLVYGKEKGPDVKFDDLSKEEKDNPAIKYGRSLTTQATGANLGAGALAPLGGFGQFPTHAPGTPPKPQIPGEGGFAEEYFVGGERGFDEGQGAREHRVRLNLLAKRVATHS